MFKLLRVSIYVSNEIASDSPIYEKIKDLGLCYRILGIDYSMSLKSCSLNVHHVFVKDKKSLERCLDVYFKTFQVMIKAKSKLDGANVLIGRTELFADEASQATLAIREAAIVAGSVTFKLNYMIVLDQPRANKQSEDPTYKIDNQTLATFHEWQGIFLAPSDKCFSHYNEFGNSVSQSLSGPKKPKTRIVMQALPACMVRQLIIKKNDTTNLQLIESLKQNL